MKNKIRLTFIALVIVFVLTACGTSGLVGRWTLSDGYGDINWVDFFSNGTYTSNHPIYEDK